MSIAAVWSLAGTYEVLTEWGIKFSTNTRCSFGQKARRQKGLSQKGCQEGHQESFPQKARQEGFPQEAGQESCQKTRCQKDQGEEVNFYLSNKNGSFKSQQILNDPLIIINQIVKYYI